MDIAPGSHDLYAFVRSRIAMGRMEPIAVSRVNRAVRTLDREGCLMLCRPEAPADTQRTGKLITQAVPFVDACVMVNMYHRHHASPIGHLFSGGVFDGAVMCGAVIVGRPVSRHQDDGETVELIRVVADGTRNACSKVMGWAIREARQRGYRRVITYTLDTEPGGSLRAVGFQQVASTKGGSWNVPSRRRAPDRHPTGPKLRWEISC